MGQGLKTRKSKFPQSHPRFFHQHYSPNRCPLPSAGRATVVWTLLFPGCFQGPSASFLTKPWLLLLALPSQQEAGSLLSLGHLPPKILCRQFATGHDARGRNTARFFHPRWSWQRLSPHKLQPIVWASLREGRILQSLFNKPLSPTALIFSPVLSFHGPSPNTFQTGKICPLYQQCFIPNSFASCSHAIACSKEKGSASRPGRIVLGNTTPA